MNPSSHQTPSDEQPLRLALPACYEHLQAQFALDHLHPYDVKASAIPEGSGYVIVLRYGEELAQSSKQFFELEAIEVLSAELTDFFRETAQLCKKALIADYYKMMKP